MHYTFFMLSQSVYEIASKARPPDAENPTTRQLPLNHHTRYTDCYGLIVLSIHIIQGNAPPHSPSTSHPGSDIFVGGDIFNATFLNRHFCKNALPGKEKGRSNFRTETAHTSGILHPVHTGHDTARVMTHQLSTHRKSVRMYQCKGKKTPINTKPSPYNTTLHIVKPLPTLCASAISILLKTYIALPFPFSVNT